MKSKWLKPAVLYKEEISIAMKSFYYTDEMMYETGGLGNWCPMIVDEPNESVYQFAVVDNTNKLVGLIVFQIDWWKKCVDRFGIISFEKNSNIMGLALSDVMNTLLYKWDMHRIEWRMISGNPVERHYDTFIKRYNGTKIVLHDVTRDRNGKYHDDIIYEIVNEENKIMKVTAKGRNEGKTTELIKVSCEMQCPIVCMTLVQKRYIVNQAKLMNYNNLPKPVLFEDIRKKNIKVDKVLIDNAEDILAYLFNLDYGTQVAGISVTKE